MAERKRGLGRGIGALIPTSAGDERPVDVFFPDRGTPASDDGGLLEVPGARLAAIAPDDIVPNAVNPRKHFDDEALDELIASVREFGVLQPIVVRPRVGVVAGEPAYELVMGERRLRASKAAGLAAIPAVVRETADEVMLRASKAAGLATIPAVVRETADEVMLRDALLENLHRADLNPIEEAEAYQQLLEDFGVTQEQLAERIGRSRPQISNTIRLLRLPEPVRRRVAAGVLSQGHAVAILSVGDEAAMLRLADKIVNEELSVRAAEAAASTVKGAPSSKKPRAGRRQAVLDDLAARIGDRLDTRVSIALGASKGRIVIEFATVADLNRIADELGVDRG